MRKANFGKTSSLNRDIMTQQLMKPEQLKRTILTLVFCCACVSSTAFAAALYFVTDLGTLGGLTSVANGINNKGQVVGSADTTNGSGHAFLYDSGHMTDLGTLGGSTSGASAINDNGQIVGAAYSASGANHAFLYGGIGMVDLGTMGGSWSIARGINNYGQVVGYANIGGYGHGFLYSGGIMTDLNTLTGVSCNGYAINDKAQLAGNAFPSGSHYGSAFLYSGGSLTYLGNYYGSIATAINNKGQVVVNPNGTTSHALLYDRGRTIDLGTLWSSFSDAYGINDSGQVVGMAYAALDTPHAFLYSGGHMSDLNNLVAPGSGLTLTYANGINAAGQIVGYGNDASGNSHAYLATPYRTLFIDPVGPNLAISWFTNAPVALSLFQSTNLASVNWVSVANVPIVTNGQYRVLLSPSRGASQWFRLQSQ